MVEESAREKSAQARRRLIVDTAVKCFAEKGFHQTSMRDLANRAGVSLGNVYNHFDSKTELILEIAKLEAEELAEFERSLDKFDCPQEALDYFIVNYAKLCADREIALLTAEIMSEGLRNVDIGVDFSNNRKLLISTIAGVIRNLWDQKTSKTNIQPEDCATFVLDLIEGTAFRFAFERKMPNKSNLAILKAGVHQLVGLDG